jgi:hypothetical protein
MSHATQLHDRGYLADDMQIMQRCALPGNVQDEVYRQVRARTVATVKWTLEQALVLRFINDVRVMLPP